ncbi:FUSC family protein [Pseudochelatococcus contaminans]|uniref:Putative membrane protein YccC n=1 Tax=Pseudochelatococcus contaminans TaxID=1538103 RepID=A0A7W5Z623_9HYPH|nr:FUSC family protein [Pseudochelatococcus contaminans]MBB3810495.1 putative membrane protein YccC [Pseudochelatococcus contaminans]
MTLITHHDSPQTARTDSPANSSIAWLRELARLKPAPWTWGQTLRGAFSVGLVLTFGSLTNSLTESIFLAIGIICACAGEPVGSYKAKARRIVVTLLIASIGAFAGHLDAFPWVVVVGAMTALGFLATIVSSYGAVYSIGTMQAMVIAAVSIGLPEVRPDWHLSAMFLTGGALYLTALGVEAALLRRYPERHAVSDLMTALAGLAATRAAKAHLGITLETTEIATARAQVTERMSALYAFMLDIRSHFVGRSYQANALAFILQRADAVFAIIMSETDAAVLDAAAKRLTDGAAAELKGAAAPAASGAANVGNLLQAVENLIAASTGSVDATVQPSAPPVKGHRDASGWFSITFGRLTPGRDTVVSAARTGLCMGLAYAIHWVYPLDHWYWVPLTVTLVMKPDLGPIFVRAVLRSIGTILGAGIGAVGLLILPKGPALLIAIILLTGLLPWAQRRSYAVLALVVTPLILILEDVVIAGSNTVYFGWERIVATIAGSAIVLVFGYFVWPREQASQLNGTFQAARLATADYLKSTLSADTNAVSTQRRLAYAQLSDMRRRLQMSLAEPPPACYEAAAWFPLVASAERVCDMVTTFSASTEPVTTADAQAISQLATRVAGTPSAASPGNAAPTAGSSPDVKPTPDQDVATLIDGIGNELAYITRLQKTESVPIIPGPALH